MESTINNHRNKKFNRKSRGEVANVRGNLNNQLNIFTASDKGITTREIAKENKKIYLKG